MIAFLDILDTQEEKERFTCLYNSYKDLLYWIALNKTHNNEDAEECVQETFFYVAKNFGKIEDIKSAKTKKYLSTIVTGFAINVYNNSKKTVFSADEASIDLEIEYFENYDETELLYVFDTVLDEESRIFFYLKYLFGYKSKEIANMYNVNDTYVRKKIQYAKEKLKNCLKDGDAQ